MARRTWKCRKIKGWYGIDTTLSVGVDALRIRPNASQYVPWYGESPRHQSQDGSSIFGRLKILGGVVVLIVLPVYTIYLVKTGDPVIGILTGLSSLRYYYLFWNTYSETVLSLSSLERVSLDEDERALTVSYEPESPLSWRRLIPFGSEFDSATFELSTDDAVREAREVFQRRDIPVDYVADTTVTVSGFEVEEGVYFCEDCGNNVSPTDSRCPSCGYAFRTTEDGTPVVEPATEV